jgi:TPR repeat protein
MMPRTLMMLAGVVITVLCSALSWAGFKEGAEAYQRGDYTTALKEFRSLAEQGDAGAQYVVGMMYFKGNGAPQDYKEAVRWFRLAAEQGNSLAQVNLGNLYLLGKGVPQDDTEALKWLRPAAEEGVNTAQMKLGIIYQSGKGVPQDYIHAHMWFNLAGVQGNKKAAELRDNLAKQMTTVQIVEAQRLAREWRPKKHAFHSGSSGE